LGTGPDLLARNPAGKVPVLRMGDRVLSESQAICEYLDETVPDPSLIPRDPLKRYEVRRLCAWFDDKFHREVTTNLLYERLMKRVTKQGYPDGKAIREGASRIKYHLDYMAWLLEQRRWLAGDAMTLADFAAAAHLSCLDYASDVDWDRQAVVKDWYAKIKSRPSFRSCWPTWCRAARRPQHYADLDF
jgi:glutathione S-transferase